MCHVRYDLLIVVVYQILSRPDSDLILLKWFLNAVTFVSVPKGKKPVPRKQPMVWK